MELLAVNSLESLLIMLGIILLSAISNWVQRRRQTQGQGGGNEEARPTPLPPPSSRDSRAGSAPPAPRSAPVAPGPPTGPKPAPRFNWEEELRRLLEGDLEPAPAPQPRPPPPVAPRTSRAVLSPPPLPRAAIEAEEVKGPGCLKGRCANCGGRFEFPSGTAGETILCPHCRQPTRLVPLPAPSLPSVMSSKELASLRESAQAFRRASQLHEQVGDRVRQTGAHTEHPLVTAPPPHRPAASTEVLDTVGMLRHRRSARQLIMASVVLGPPRALEGYN